MVQYWHNTKCVSSIYLVEFDRQFILFYLTCFAVLGLYTARSCAAGRSVIRRVSCRHVKVRQVCGRQAADWQKTFSLRFANVIPNSLTDVIRPDDESVVSLRNCAVFKNGKQLQCCSLLTLMSSRTLVVVTLMFSWLFLTGHVTSLTHDVIERRGFQLS